MISHRRTAPITQGIGGLPIPTAFDEAPQQQRPSEWARLLLVMLFLHKRLIATLVALTVVLTTIACFTLPKLYAGSFTIIVKGTELDTTSLVPGSGIQTGARPVTPQSVANEQRILTSTELANSVLADLHKRHDTLQLSWSNEAKPGFVKAFTGWFGDTLHTVHHWFVKEEPSDDEGGGSLSGDPLIQSLRGIVEVTPGVGNDVLDVRVKHFDKRMTDDILRTYLKSYLEQRSEIWSTTAAPEFYQKQTESVVKELDDINRQIQQIRTDPVFVAPGEEKSRLVTQLGDMVSEVNKLAVREQELTSLADRARTLSPRSIRSLPIEGTSTDPLLGQIGARMGQLEGQRAEMLRNFEPGSSMVAAVDRELGTLGGQYKAIVTEFLTNDLANVRGRKKQLEGQIEDLKARIPHVEEAEQRITLLEQRRHNLQDQVTQFQKKSWDVDVENEVRTRLLPNVAVVSKPWVDPVAHFPQRGTLIPLAAIVGLFLGAVGAVLLELLDDSFKLPEQIVRELGVPVLATYPLEQAA